MKSVQYIAFFSLFLINFSFASDRSEEPILGDVKTPKAIHQDMENGKAHLITGGKQLLVGLGAIAYPLYEGCKAEKNFEERQKGYLKGSVIISSDNRYDYGVYSGQTFMCNRTVHDMIKMHEESVYYLHATTPWGAVFMFGAVCVFKGTWNILQGSRLVAKSWLTTYKIGQKFVKGA